MAEWNPMSFEEVFGQLESSSMLLALQVKGTRKYPSPWWDPAGRYRVALAAGRPEIQRHENDQWVAAPAEPPDTAEDEGAVAVAAAMTQLFVSHSSKDADLAKALVRMIDACLDVPSFTLRCTSVAGYDLEAGARVGDDLRTSLHSAKVVLGLLTENSVESAYVLMELGAAWVLRHHVIPLVSGSALQQVPGPIGADLHFTNVAHETAIHGVLESIASRCGWRWRGNAARRHAAVKDFVTHVGALAKREVSVSAGSSQPATTRPNAAELQAGLALLQDYLSNILAAEKCRRQLRKYERGTAPVRPAEVEKAKAALARWTARLEEKILAVHDWVERATGSKADWNGVELTAGLDEKPRTDVRAAIGRLNEWLEKA
jgi:hypothetical protein